MSAPDFEARYRADPDPWSTATSPYEQEKRERSLAACGPGPFRRAVDLGCGTGALAAGLAPRCRELLALDAARSAVAVARDALREHPGARAHVATLPRDLPDGSFDLVVAAELLYYLPGRSLTAVLAWLDGALAPGGRVLAVHWAGSAPDLLHDADTVHEAILARPGLRSVLTHRGDRYRLDLLESP
ncbi:class I SAM-dependent DNA methyltransferase [Baekduia soli]|uniref:class I SAM-dependent DNA methyltransferase n=1 Tax=Baekduia soli TaxID=496014 RepID=UPI0016523464|nr:class I SAM-dependent methyltransferase [Baekduia soli]